MSWLTADDEGVDGHPVVLVLLVGVGAPEAEAGHQGTDEVSHGDDDDEGGDASDVACKEEESTRSIICSGSGQALAYRRGVWRCIRGWV